MAGFPGMQELSDDVANKARDLILALIAEKALGGGIYGCTVIIGHHADTEINSWKITINEIEPVLLDADPIIEDSRH